MRMRLLISYDGKEFSGFQAQKDKRCVQSVLQDALKKLYGEDICVTASGRTDAGVHALGQVVHFDAFKEIAANKVAGALNHFLPSDIRVREAEQADERFNARKSAKQKTYFYDMYFSKIDNPLLFLRAHRLDCEPDVAKMEECAALFVGKHDFREFYCLGSSAKTTVRSVTDCRFERLTMYGENVLRFYISADGFLYKMVRLITGALIKAGTGSLTKEEILGFIECKKEYLSKLPAPACGLCLEKVIY